MPETTTLEIVWWDGEDGILTGGGQRVAECNIAQYLAIRDGNHLGKSPGSEVKGTGTGKFRPSPSLPTTPTRTKYKAAATHDSMFDWSFLLFM